jgi:hypothetical protein
LSRSRRSRGHPRPLYQLAWCSVPHRNFVSCLDQVRCHRLTHDSQPYKSNSHKNFSFVLSNGAKRNVFGLDMTTSIKVKQSGTKLGCADSRPRRFVERLRV